MLILPIWYDRFAQFVPGQMSADSVELIIKGGISESAPLWEASTTELHNLQPTRVPGERR
ncbi:MAG: hypothetical protein U0903_00695 [Planctomycetales bacterium]